MFDEMREDPAAGEDLGLLERELSPGVDVGDHAEADIDLSKNGGLKPCHVMGTGIDPEAALETGERLGGHGGRVPVGVGLEVQDDFGRAGGGGLDSLRLSGRVGVDHGFGHEADKVNRHLFAAGVALDVVGEGIGRVDHGLQPRVLVQVFLPGEGAIFFGDEAGDGSVPGLDDITNLIALGIDGVDAVTQEGLAVLNDRDFVAGCIFCPGPWAKRENVRTCERASGHREEQDGESDAAKESDARTRYLSVYGGVISWPGIDAVQMYGFHSSWTHRVFDVCRGCKVGCLPQGG